MAMKTYEISGTVEHIGATRAVGSNGFTMRDVVLETKAPKSQYPNPVLVQLKKDKCALADTLKVGNRVTVTFTIDGRKWDKGDGSEPRWFTTLTAWKIAVDGGAEANPQPVADAVTDADEGGDLPF